MMFYSRYGRLSVPTCPRRPSFKTTRRNGYHGWSVPFFLFSCSSFLSFGTMTCTQWRASAGTGFLKKRRTTLPRTHPPWTSISTRSSSGGHTRRLSTRPNEATFASSRLPSSADKAYPKTTSTCTLRRCPLSQRVVQKQCLFCSRSTVRGLRFQFQGESDVHRHYCHRRENGRGEGETYQQGALEGLRANVCLVL